LSGDYAQFETQQEASKEFAKNVEKLIRNEIKDYILAATPKPEKTASAIAGNRPLG
jgi:Txe/YoeB family toxin of Txe-Axe toxin-antitoxin module